MSRNILIIGGTKGIGLQIAQSLKEEDNVLVVSRDATNAVTGTTHIEQDVIEKGLDGIDLPDEIHGFVYCPGSINLKPFNMLNEDSFRQDLEINFMGLLKCFGTCEAALKKGKASVVFFSTVAVGTGMPFHTSVAAAKGAVEGFARALAAEYAPSLRVNVIAPSLTNTPLAKRLLSNDKKKEMMAQRHPMQRYGEANDIAQAAVFLLSKDSSWMTGQTMGIDGGLSTLNVS